MTINNISRKQSFKVGVISVNPDVVSLTRICELHSGLRISHPAYLSISTIPKRKSEHLRRLPCAQLMAPTIIIIIVYIEYCPTNNGNEHVMKIDFRCGCVFDAMVYSRLFWDLSSANDDAKPKFFVAEFSRCCFWTNNSWVGVGELGVGVVSVLLPCYQYGDG